MTDKETQHNIHQLLQLAKQFAIESLSEKMALEVFLNLCLDESLLIKEGVSVEEKEMVRALLTKTYNMFLMMLDNLDLSRKLNVTEH
jgi:hypothetical protein